MIREYEQLPQKEREAVRLYFQMMAHEELEEVYHEGWEEEISLRREEIDKGEVEIDDGRRGGFRQREERGEGAALEGPH